MTDTVFHCRVIPVGIATAIETEAVRIYGDDRSGDSLCASFERGAVRGWTGEKVCPQPTPNGVAFGRGFQYGCALRRSHDFAGEMFDLAADLARSVA